MRILNYNFIILKLSAAEHIVEDRDTEEDLLLLFAPGSSLGGARPKASVLEKDGRLAIAKFPRRDDEFNTVVWEALALTLAKKAGIALPLGRLETVSNSSVLLLRRFYRDGARRIPLRRSRWLATFAGLRSQPGAD